MMPRIFHQARDPISSYSHFLGAGLSVVGLILMLFRLSKGGNASATTVTACVLFCLSLIALYTASGTYHFSRASDQVVRMLRKLDHAMIYILIAGSYTPILLSALPRPKNMVFTAAMWVVAAAGIVLKLCWIDAPRWLGTSLYILMGWAILVDLPALAALPPFEIFLMAAGGVAYTIGGVIYLLKRPNPTPAFGFHELFHVFVLIGSLCHYCMVFYYVAS